MTETLILKSKNKQLSITETEAFIKDHEIACKTMDASNFRSLFLKYDLSFVGDFQDVFNSIIEAMTVWKSVFKGTELREINVRDSNCIFCSIGKKVKVYNWTYLHTGEDAPMNKFVCYSRIAFMFDIQDDMLKNYGICNAYI
ncbi:hypothetical protein [Flavobacterium tegetincola]|uniref:hypothetical protein n=1 Tax=Flavobacterium tegetincola TaxID=150172 RepID=UPI00047CE1F3|nr:hypothetical protein [Flavobacterium tegetincola]